jgi:AcrR family transcriptional regulator
VRRQTERTFFYDRRVPRVSQRHRDARRRQIVDAARRCFTRNGFQATSMQDIFAEAELSSGAVYGYFASKEDLVGTIADEVIEQVTTAFDAVLGIEEPPPLDEVLARMFDVLDRPDVAKLAVQVWGEALRNPALGERLAARYRALRERLARLAAVYQRRGLLDPDTSAEDVARVLSALGPAFLLQRSLLADVETDQFHRGLRALIRRG